MGVDMFKKKTIAMYIIAVVILYFLIYIIPDALGLLRSSYPVQYGELTVSRGAEGVVIRDEMVYNAGTSGDVNYLIKDDDLVRVGTKILDLNGTNVDSDEDLVNLGKKPKNKAMVTSDFTAQGEGLVSFFCDGYEGVFNPENEKSVSYNNISKLTDKSLLNLRRKKIAAKEPVFKIVERSHWKLICYTNIKYKDEYKANTGIKVNIKNKEAGRDDTIIMFIESVSKEKNRLRLVMSSDRYYSGFTKDRKVSVNLINSVNKGLIIKNSSITKDKSGRKGVMVRDKIGDYVFKPIQVISTDGENSVIRNKLFFDKKGQAVETIVTYDQILTRP